MKVLFIGQWFKPEPAQMPRTDVRVMEEAGHSVTVLTGKPHYPEGVLHKGWDQKRTDRQESGRRVVRTAEYPSHSASAIGRIANYLSWSLSSIPDAVRLARGADVMLVYGSPITAAMPALIAKAVSGTPVIIQVQDMWPESLFTFRTNSRIFRAIEKPAYAVCNWVYSKADRLIAISPGAVERMAARGIDTSSTTLVYNPATDEGDVVPRKADDGPIRLLYGGNLGPNQRLDVVIEAVSRHPNVMLTLMGKGTDRGALEQKARQLNASNVTFRDPVFGSGYREAVAEHDVMIVSLKDEDVFSYTMPSKTQAILSFGRPILGICAGDLAAVVRDSGAGWVAAPEDVDSVDEVISDIEKTTRGELNELGAKGRKFYEKTMSLKTFAQRTNEVLEKAVTQSVSSRGGALAWLRGRRKGTRKHVPNMSWGTRVAKRAMDLGVAVPVFLLTAPIQAVAALAIRATMGSPVLFEQPRPGLGGEVFHMRKFRTMRPIDENASVESNSNVARITPVGRFLRSTSIDELPTLWHVITGEMSLVGPRPLLVSYLDLYSPEQSRRHEVKPGITGLAQISGRNSTTWEKRLRLDVEYVDTASILKDIKILLATVGPVLTRSGVSQSDNVTMPPFTGTEPTESTEEP